MIIYYCFRCRITPVDDPLHCCKGCVKPSSDRIGDCDGN